MTTDPTPEQTLATPMPTNDAGAESVGDYLVKLLTLLWSDREDFDAKRPFGYSSWDNVLYIALINAGYITGEINESGELVHIDDSNDERGTKLIAQAIRALRPAT